MNNSVPFRCSKDYRITRYLSSAISSTVLKTWQTHGLFWTVCPSPGPSTLLSRVRVSDEKYLNEPICSDSFFSNLGIQKLLARHIQPMTMPRCFSTYHACKNKYSGDNKPRVEAYDNQNKESCDNSQLDLRPSLRSRYRITQPVKTPFHQDGRDRSSDNITNKETCEFVNKGNTKNQRTSSSRPQISVSNYNQGLPGLGKRNGNRLNHIQYAIQGEILFGLFPVLLALQQGKRTPHALKIRKKLLSSQKKSVTDILSSAQEKNISIEGCSLAVLDQLAQNRPHQGVCLDCSKIQFEEITEESRSIPADQKPQLWLLLDSIQDPMNLGAILRSSYYLGVNKVLAVKKNSCALSPVVSKASAGTLEVLPVHAVSHLTSFLQEVSDCGWQVIGAVGSGYQAAVPLSSLTLKKNTVLVMGNEGQGLTEEVIRLCDDVITVSPGRSLHSGLDSLNVSVATGILLYHLLHRRD